MTTPKTPTTVPIVQKLLDQMHPFPLALGIYMLVGRLYVIEQGPVPLSDKDICTYDPSLRRGAVLRAMKRLKRERWLLLATSDFKSTYIPTWGPGRDGKDRPWDMTAPSLGRPGHIPALFVPVTVLDEALGRIAVHHTQAVRITRFNQEETALGSLREVGLAILAQAEREGV